MRKDPALGPDLQAKNESDRQKLLDAGTMLALFSRLRSSALAWRSGSSKKKKKRGYF
jgi:hypothetical protein